MLCGYDPSRPVDADFRKPRKFVAPIRPAPVLKANAHRTRILYEGTCVVCLRDFSRMYRPDQPEPKTCGIQCAGQLGRRRRG